MSALDQAFIKAYKHQEPADRFSPNGSQSARRRNPISTPIRLKLK